MTRVRVATLATLLATLATAAEAAQFDTLLLSRQPGSTPQADDTAFNPTISADGRYVAFDSDVDELSTEDDDDIASIFVRDIVTDGIELISRATGPNGAVADSDAQAASISADGRYVAFETDAENLSDQDDPFAMGEESIFVRDRVQDTTSLVSVNSSEQSADAGAFNPRLSAGGTHVAFETAATNFGSPVSGRQVYVRDLVAGTTTLISRASTAGGAPAANPFVTGISANGRFVAFQTSDENVSTEDSTSLGTGGQPIRDVFIRDTVDHTTTLVSRGADPANDHSLGGPISDDGRYALFHSNATNLSDADADAAEDLFVRDTQDQTTVLVNRATGETGVSDTGVTSTAALSGDGRHAAFSTASTTISDEDAASAVVDVFVRDLDASTTTLVSRATGAAGAPGDGDSTAAVLSRDGGVVAFASRATNLGFDANDAGDVFARILGQGPSPDPDDGDGGNDGANGSGSGGGEQTPAPSVPSPPPLTLPAPPPEGLPNPLSPPVFTRYARPTTRRSGATYVVTTGIAVACGARGGACTTTLTARRRRGRRRNVLAGRRRFTTQPGRTTRLRFRLNRSAARRLRSRKRLRVRLTLTATTPGLPPVTLTTTLTLRRR